MDYLRIALSLTVGLLALTVFPAHAKDRAEDRVEDRAEDRTGEAVYNCTCIVCHGTGLLRAPRLGDAKRWGKLIGEGLDDLVPSSLHGERAMPPKGNNPNLSDMEVARAVIFMANAGGGKFTEPTAEEVTRWRGMADRKAKTK
jgi:cytochrome c5